MAINCLRSWQGVIAGVVTEETGEWDGEVGKGVAPGAVAVVWEDTGKDAERAELTGKAGFGEMMVVWREVSGIWVRGGKEADKLFGGEWAEQGKR